MKSAFFLSLLFFAAPVRAQLPVIDVAAIAKAVAQLVELRNQVRLLQEDLAVAKQIRGVTTRHLSRYQRALTKRGLVESMPLGSAADDVETALSGAVSYLNPAELDALYVLHAMPEDPLAYDKAVAARGMNTITHTMQSLSVHGQQIGLTHQELERFKREISNNPEPQQMMDVQASLQVLAAREALLTRQALMTLTNMEAVRAAHTLNREAQRRAVYGAFVGHTDWLGDPSRYRVAAFLRMPGE